MSSSKTRISLYTKIFKSQEKVSIFSNFFLLIFVSSKNEKVIIVNSLRYNKVEPIEKTQKR